MDSPQRALFSLLLASIVAPAAPAQRAHDIGSLGARVDTEAKWVRKRIDANLTSTDQFELTRGGLLSSHRVTYVIVREHRGVLETPTDFRRLLDEMSSEGRETPVEMDRGAAVTRATRTFDCEIDGMHCSFRCEVLARDGLAYHFMYWSLRTHRTTLLREAKAFRDGFVFPGPDSDWAKSHATKQQRVTAGSYEIVFDLRSDLLSTQPRDDDDLCQFASEGEQQVLRVMKRTVEGDVQSAFADESRMMKAWDASFVERDRREITIDGIGCGRLIAATSAHSFVTLLIPVGERAWVAMRYGTPGEGDRPLRDAIFASLRIRKVESGLQLPALVGEPTAEAHDRLHRFGTILPVLGSIDAWHTQAAWRDGEAWLVSTWNRLYRVTAQDCTSLASSEHGGFDFVLRWRKDLLVGKSGVVHWVHENKLGPPLFDAVCADTLGDDLLLVRDRPSALPELKGAGHQILFRRYPSGKESNLLTVPGRGASAIVVARDLSRALLTGSWHSDATDVDGDGARAWLAVVDLRRSSIEHLPRWVRIGAIAAADDGWLVTGTPRDGPAGIWLVRNSREREPLITGIRLRGLAANSERLTFVRSSGGVSRVHDVPLADCRAEGRNCQPFAACDLDTIGGKLVAELGVAVPRTAAEITAARGRATVIARTIRDADLPTSPANVDALIEAIQPQGIGAHGRIVVALLIAAAAVDDGASWVEGGVVDWASWLGVGSYQLQNTPFATLADPRSALVSALDDTDADSTVFDGNQSWGGGRVTLLGLDAVSLRQHAAALVPPEFAAALAAADVAKLTAICAGLPDNTYLRDAVCKQLAAAGKVRAVEDFARPFAASSSPAASDLVAWLTAWQTRAAEPAAAREVFDAALRAVQQHPREATLYLCLGRAATRAFADEPAKARQCFDRVLALSDWGAVADAAKAELTALQERANK